MPVEEDSAVASEEGSCSLEVAEASEDKEEEGLVSWLVDKPVALEGPPQLANKAKVDRPKSTLFFMVCSL